MKNTMWQDHVEHALDRLARDDGFSGVVLIRKGDTDILAQARGYASRRWNIANTIDTRFPHASITKMFTAVALLQLLENGLCTLDTRVVDYLDLAHTSIPENVTLENLLVHTSGIGDYIDEEAADKGVFCSRDIPNYTLKNLSDFVPLFAHKKPLFPVGQRFEYCNAGYILLGLVIEKASGMSYFDYIRENVFARAGMQNTDFLFLDSTNGQVAEGHIPVKGVNEKILGWRTNIYAVPIRGASDSGAITTAHDCARFMKSLRTGVLLSEAMTKEMLVPHVRVDTDADELWSYGYGMWFIMNKDNKVIRYGHSGDDPGINATVYYYPAYDIDVIILGNQSDCAEPLNWEIQDIILHSE